MRIRKYFLAFLSICIFGSGMGIYTYAAPEFSRSESEWEKLRDNTLEYGEITGLIEEYNASVKINEMKLRDFDKDYGRTNAEVSENYRKAAAEVLDSIGDADPTSPTYVSTLAANAGAESTAKNLLSNADSTLEDYETQRLNYENIKYTLAQNAKNRFINYYIDTLSLQISKNQREVDAYNLDILRAKATQGLVTNLTLLSTENALEVAGKDIAKSEADLTKDLKTLQTMTGWSYEASPVLGSMPVPDMEKITSLNPDADADAAIANNYTIKANQRRLENTVSDGKKSSLQMTIDSEKTGIKNALTSAYVSVLSAKSGMDNAALSYDLAKAEEGKARVQESLGMITKTAYQIKALESENKRLEWEKNKLALVLAMDAYDWICKGIASVN